ncbi:hypothetical protein ACCQ12_15170 [Xanthomonas sp. NCPPB 1068]|uniref:hypothetical protein n=1 Tax=Xanthomonas sp. NCPPB 1068 TaxID=487525 RepID=UPI0035561816
MDAADKGRRRFTSTTEDVTFAMLLPASGVQVLLDFFSITLREVHRFEWVDFRDPSRRPAIYQFKQRPSISDETPWLFRASLQLKLFSQLNGKFLLSDENRSVLIDVDNNGLTT